MVYKSFETFERANTTVELINGTDFDAKIVAYNPVDDEGTKVRGSWDIVEYNGDYYIQVDDEHWRIVEAEDIQVHISK
jgi:hypothetical protein